MKKKILKYSLFVVILAIITSCGTSDPSTKFKGKRFQTLEVKVFGMTSRQNIYFSEDGNNLSTYNTNEGGSNNGTWEFIDEEKKKIKINVTDEKYYWRSGIWEFNDDYTSINHNDRDELYLRSYD
ncbi:hypothetical protein [Daejeonella sp.]|jgi:hypothetical protein|uniref:hypothetical protein n=1 Tax=Daejeonella sp. TaxID=2805397 RepID=UPI0027BA619D|nr:hypothetical protein [Daejeonella sp.]